MATGGSGANAVTFQIDDLDSYGGNLYACGYFRWLGQDHITAIARWDGTAWSGLGEDGPLAGGRDRYYEAPYCHEMALWRGRLAVVGRFDSAGGTSSRDLAQWTASVGSRAPPVQRADEILGFGPYLLVGGTAFPLGEDFFGKPYLRAWDGDRWLDLGHGVWSGSPNIHTAPEVTAMAVWNGDLYVAGRFRAAGDHPARYLAVWHGDVQARPVFRKPPRRPQPGHRSGHGERGPGGAGAGGAPGAGRAGARGGAAGRRVPARRRAVLDLEPA